MKRTVVFGSRIPGKGALKGGMLRYKYIVNRLLTFIQNILMNQKLSECHTGCRAYSGEILKKINFNKNSEDYIFDNEMVALILNKGYEIAEITCPTKYCAEASSINFRRSIKYGFGVLRISVLYCLSKHGFYNWRFLSGEEDPKKQ